MASKKKTEARQLVPVTEAPPPAAIEGWKSLDGIAYAIYKKLEFKRKVFTYMVSSALRKLQGYQDETTVTIRVHCRVLRKQQTLVHPDFIKPVVDYVIERYFS